MRTAVAAIRADAHRRTLQTLSKTLAVHLKAFSSAAGTLVLWKIYFLFVLRV